MRPRHAFALAISIQLLSSLASAQFSATRPLPSPARVAVPSGAQFLSTACGTYDDGASESSLGLTFGGETGWLHFQDCLATVDRIETAYYTPAGDVPPNSSAVRIVCYEDADCDGDPTTPASGMTLMWSLATTTSNESTDILNVYPYPGDMGGTFTNAAPSSCTFVMAAAEHSFGESPAPMDQTSPTANAWVVGQSPSGSRLDITNLNDNNVAPLQMIVSGFPTTWLLRASGDDPCATAFPTVCIGNGPCPCNNEHADCNGGCTNSTGAGALLAGSGLALLTSDSLVLAAGATPNQPGMFFQGDSVLSNMPFLGDGRRCCGNDVIRIGTYAPSGNSTDTATGNQIGGLGPPISQLPGNAGLLAGDSRCYQWWYRDTVGGPCGSGFNLSNGVLVTWGA